jgi:hypothetical protein
VHQPAGWWCQLRKCTHHGDEFMARITAQRLVKHLEACGFVLMMQPKRWGDTSRIGSGLRKEN